MPPNNGIKYQANITRNVDLECKYYLGLKERTFKSGVLDCGRSIKKESEKTSIEFPKYVCLLKKDGKIPIIKRKIIQLVFSKMISNFCKLCFMEKYYILNFLGYQRCLNKRNKFFTKCLHQNKLLLKYFYDSND